MNRHSRIKNVTMAIVITIIWLMFIIGILGYHPYHANKGEIKQFERGNNNANK